MAEVQETRRKLQIATATLVVLNVALAAVFFSPIVGSQRSRKEELNRLWKEQQQKTREVEPLRKIVDLLARGGYFVANIAQRLNLARFLLLLFPQPVEFFLPRTLRAHDRRKEHRRQGHVQDNQSRGGDLQLPPGFLNFRHYGVLRLVSALVPGSGTYKAVMSNWTASPAACDC